MAAASQARRLAVASTAVVMAVAQLLRRAHTAGAPGSAWPITAGARTLFERKWGRLWH